ncbi:MAG: NAD-dependent epimerase/dehydratase family protein [Chitinivibrionales bacterium]|nr:NAD-dependent epimerase/dehydratase family protein [Chitinivibrionales bacterium]
MKNSQKTCWNCPAVDFKGNVDFRACGQSTVNQEKLMNDPSGGQVMVECKRRRDLGLYDPTSITFEDCPQWEKSEYGYKLKNMKVMILGMDGYLGWPLALKLGKLGFNVSGVDCYYRRDWVAEKGSHTAVPITRMSERIRSAREVLDIDLNFRRFDILDRSRLKEFIDEVKPEAIIHYAECPSAPYSMVDVDHAIWVQKNNVLGSLGLLFTMKELVPESSLIKLGTMGEYGAPLTGRPIFEGIFPGDAVLKWGDREWSLGGELTPRDPVSFYHVSKVQDTFNAYEACKYWWLRSYDVMQGVIYGVHTNEVASDPRLRTRFDIDEWFGTAINRFVSQAIVGIPLSIYGKGKQVRSFIALRDAMQCMVRLICSPPEPGQYDVVNQMTGFYELRQLAETVAKIGKKEFGLKPKMQRLQNPRVEADDHPFEPLFDKLPEQFGLKSEASLEEEVYEMFKLLSQPEIKARIEEKRHVILPKTTWGGQKRQMEILEEWEM